MNSVSRIEDGRRKRGDQNRRQIVEAMLELVREGDMTPGAAAVAERAGVGLRTVFRHFEEMEVLYREMAEVISGKLQPLLRKPYTKSGWRDRLDEMVERRIVLFEEIMPLRIAGSVLRFRSQFLMEDYKSNLRMEHEALEAILPESIRKDLSLFRAIEMVTSFQSWRRLRKDQELSVADAHKVVTRLIDGLLGASG